MADLLERECRVFARYLAGSDPSPATLAAYRRAHEHVLATDLEPGGSRGERALLALARRGPARARAADGFARFFAKKSTLRRKLVTLLAILECDAPSARTLDTADAGSAAGFLVRFTLAGLGFGLRFALVALWLPFGALLAGGDR